MTVHPNHVIGTDRGYMVLRIGLIRDIFHFGLATAALVAGTGSAAAVCTLGVMANLPVTMEGLRASVPLKVNGK